MPWIRCLVALLLAGCIDRPIAAVNPEANKEEQTEFPVALNRDLDILFVIDNSGSMEAEQTSLATNFVRISNALEALEDGLPNIHIGVVSTDVGAGNQCGSDPDGDDGTLQNAARELGCSPPRGRYIENIEGVPNYDGSLAETFSCIARLGKSGCGFEQPLEAMRRALDGSNPANQGFLRPNALLAVIFIADEDDCSAFDPAMFARTPEPGQPDLGPQTSFRCFRYGVECDDGADPTVFGPRQSCTPRTDSPYMVDVQEYVTFLKGLKPFESQILVAGIVGERTPVTVAPDRNQNPCLMYSCGGSDVCEGAVDLPGAVPPIRLGTFLDAFQLNHTTTICDEDLSDAVQQIADFIRDGLEGHCIQGRLRDMDPETPGLQYECSVSEIRSPATAERTERVFTPCDDEADPARSSTLPCYVIASDPATCASTPDNLSVQVYYPADETVPPDTIIRAHCVAD